MKVVAKKTIENYRMIDQLKNEVSIMSKLKHPCIIHLHTIFEDQKNIYFVLELAEEGHLYSRLQAVKKYTEDVAAKVGSSFTKYAFDVFRAVDYLHKQSPPIIHRDIKPENILFCDDHLKIADFGWSNLKDRVRTTFCGTPEYLAPEMLMEKGHNEKLDVWTLGVLLYEMLVGYSPFTPSMDGTDKSKSKEEMYEKLKVNIVNCKVSYPDFLSQESLELLKKLMVRKPSDRLSCHDALRHPFFSKHGLDAEKADKEDFQRVFEQAKNNLKEAAKSSNRRLSPKILSESDILGPSLSDLKLPLEKKKTIEVIDASKTSENQQVPRTTIDDTLEITQSIYLTDSQLQNLTVVGQSKSGELDQSSEANATKFGQDSSLSMQEIAPVNLPGKEKTELKEKEDQEVSFLRLEVSRLAKLYEEEQARVAALQKELNEKDLLISQLSQQSMSMTQQSDGGDHQQLTTVLKDL